ncbi:MAG: hypothetical protein E7261_05025 [Lachnospiraceae bacterium]|nr:hypothetical protein [Lachnospiraceae bacterium]
MKVINAGLIFIVAVFCFFVNDNMQFWRIRQTLFEKNNTNVSMDGIVTDVLGEAVVGIDTEGEAELSLKRAKMVYKGLITGNLSENAEDGTVFFVYTGNYVGTELADYLEEEVSRQIKTVNKRLNYSFLFTEQTSSFLYNPTVRKSIYIMYLPKTANIIRPSGEHIIYSLSGARLE